MALHPDEPAYPYSDDDPYGDDDITYEGLTTREYMATHLLAGLLAGRPQTRDPFESISVMRGRLARAAVAAADALIEELNKPSETAPHSVREDDGEP